jgi:beta-mannosidase
MARIQPLGSGIARPLAGEWALAATAPGLAQTPADLETLVPDWIPCVGPMTVAAALQAAGRWSLGEDRDFDREDWWYRCRFIAPDAQGPWRLRFEGLATVSDAWLNGTHLCRTESMFVSHAVVVECLRPAENELVLKFHALGPLLAVRRGLPKWRVSFVSHQQLRWYRTALVGRVHPWCPPAAAVGPWRPVLLEPLTAIRVEHADVHAHVSGDEGTVRLSARATVPPSSATTAACMVGDRTVRLSCERTADHEIVIHGDIRVPQVRRWWPHSHGAQPLYPMRLAVASGSESLECSLGRVGFRTVSIDRGTDGDGFGVCVNDVPVFSRGVCWMPSDVARLHGDPSTCRTELELLKAAGVNMVRIPGSMVYESDTFYDLCDELGLLLWQDLMFANMDYPAADDGFRRLAELEVRQLLHRLQTRPSLAVLCGSSEVEQQASMLGLREDRYANPLFADVFPKLAESITPGAPWVQSTPTGGTLPFHADRGVAHYYGVGAYLRPFDDARRAGVRFAAECLAFSNVPEPTALAAHPDVGLPGSARWDAAIPRDAGSDWDFEDVRDHYVARLFDVDPSALRAHDTSRYLALGRIATGEAMLRTIAEWRRPGSSCRGALIWCGRDLRVGAGWGILDSAGRAKAAYFYARRAMTPVALIAIDEGLNGLWLHAVNDTARPIAAELRITLYRNGRVRAEEATETLTVPPHGARSIHADAMFEGFRDITYAYRFGPPGHDVVAAALRDASGGAVLAAAHFFPCGLPSTIDPAMRLGARAEPTPDGYAILVDADRFAHAVTIEAEGFVPDDNYVHVEPGAPRRIFLRPEQPAAPRRGLRATVSALNAPGPVSVSTPEILDVR